MGKSLIETLMDSDVAQAARAQEAAKASRANSTQPAQAPQPAAQGGMQAAPQPAMAGGEGEEEGDPWPEKPFDPDTDLEELTPEEKKKYDAIMAIALSMLQGDPEQPATQEMSKHLIDVLGSERDDPAGAVATVTLMIYSTIDEQIPGKIPPELWAVVASEIAEHVIDVVHKTGLADMSGPLGGQAGQAAILLVGDYEGLTPEDMEDVLGYVPEDVGERIRGEQEGYLMPQSGGQAA